MNSKQRKQTQKQRDLVVASLPKEAQAILNERKELAVKLLKFRNMARAIQLKEKESEAKIQETVKLEMEKVQGIERQSLERIKAGKVDLQAKWEELGQAKLGFKVATDQFEKTKAYAESVGLLKEVLLALECDEEPATIAHNLRVKFNLLIPEW